MSIQDLRAQPLAVLNLDRKHLEGPSYLDALVQTSAPGQTAVCYLNDKGEQEHYSYAWLHDASDILAKQLARRLGDHKVPQNAIIPVILSQSPALYVSYLAILKLGYAFCPVSPDTPEERLRFIVGDVEAVLVICSPDFSSHVHEVLPDTICFSYDIDSYVEPEVQASTLMPRSRSQTDTAYIMYTSGSTGLPKGVVVPHISVTQALLAHDEHIPVFERFLQFASPMFDVSIFEIFFPLFRGVTLVCRTREDMLADLTGTINQLGIDALELTPTVAGTLLRTRASVPSLRCLLTIGEKMTSNVLQEFGGSETMPSLLFAAYGPTEASIHCTMFSSMSCDDDVRDIGRPLRSVTTFILDEEKAASPKVLCRGEIGELAIGGQLASGYLNRPQETESAFVELPSYGSIYRSGDRAMLTASGKLLILGRIVDGQVKLRGQRVELGEVEMAACQDPYTHHSVALVINDNLIVFCTGGPEMTKARVEAACRKWLPVHMRPADYVMLHGGFPCLPSGKVDRKILRQQYYDSALDLRDDKAPAFGGVQGTVVLRKVFSELHGVAVADDTRLQRLGIDSLRAIQLASRLREHYPSITISAILESHSIAELYQRLEQDMIVLDEQLVRTRYPQDSVWTELKKDISAMHDVVNSGGIVADVQPCSSIQTALIAETVHNHEVHWNTMFLERPDGTSYGDFLKALGHVAQLNPILRSGFVSTSSAEYPFAMIAWSSLNPHGVPSLLSPLKVTQSESEYQGGLTITIHHALYDGWSFDLVLQDINAFLAGATVAQRPSYELFTQYDLYGASSSEKKVEANLSYWSQALSGYSSEKMPCLCAELPAATMYTHKHLTASIPLSRVRNFAQALKISSQAVFQSACIVLLCALSENKAVITGFVTSGRDAAISGIEHLIGPCLKTLPLLIDTAKVFSSRDLIQYVHRQQQKSILHGSCTLRQIKSRLALSANDDLFDVLCAWQESVIQPDGFSDRIKLRKSVDSIRGAVLFEAFPDPVGDTLRLSITSRDDILPISALASALSQVDALIGTMVQHPSTELQKIWSLIQPSLLSQSCATTLAPVAKDELTSRIREMCHEIPNVTAIEFITDLDPVTRVVEKETVTYGELLVRATEMVRPLILNYGLVSDDIVCIQIRKSVNLYLLILGLVHHGIAYLCVDESTPESRFQRIIAESNCKVLVKSEAHNLVGTPPCSVVNLQDVSSLHALTSSELFSCAKPENLAYAIFTSGSTGEPKGVLITRANLQSNIVTLTKSYHNQIGRRLLQSCSQAFDVSVFEIFWTWHCGMTLCAAENDILFRDMNMFIDVVQITHLSMTPSVAALVEAPKVPSVEFMVCAGEPMSRTVFDQWHSRGLVQGYGPSETTNICTAKHGATSRTPVNLVGRAFDNTSVFVCARRLEHRSDVCLDESDFQLLPLGAQGELWFGGLQVGRGYTDPNLTAQSWLQHKTFGKLYRSGDAGRILDDGSILITGRTDDQIKIRGQRVELKEIARTLMRAAEVRSAVAEKVVLSGRELIAAFCTIYDSYDIDSVATSDSIRAVARTYLSKYMVPEALLLLRDFPLTSQGKIDKKALVKQYSQSKKSHQLGKSNLTEDRETEQSLQGKQLEIATVIAEVFGCSLESVNNRKSLLSYGVDSIGAILLARRLRERGVGTLSISDVTRSSTIDDLTTQIQTQESQRRPAVTSNTLNPRFSPEWQETITRQYQAAGYSVNRILPCTPMQEAMLAVSEERAHATYINKIVYKLTVTQSTMKDAWREVIERHDLFRTTFVQTDRSGHPYAQVVLDQYTPSWGSDVELDIRTVNEDVLSLPPYHLSLCEDNHATYLTLMLHHAIHDAATLSLIHQEIEDICHHRRLFKVVPFDRYLEFVQKIDSEESEAFWNAQLKALKTTKLSRQLALTADSLQRTFELACFIPLTVMQKSCSSNCISLQALLQGSLAQVLAHHTQQNDVCFGTIYSGRNISLEDVDRIVGPCFNNLPIRFCLSPKLSLKSMCEQADTFNSDICKFQATSLRTLSSYQGSDRGTLFDVTLLLQSPVDSLDAQIWSIDSESGIMDFPFIFEVQPCPDSDTLKIKLHAFNTDADAMHALLIAYQDALDKFIAFPEASSLEREFLSSDDSPEDSPLTSYQNSHDTQKDSCETLDSYDMESSKTLDLVIEFVCGVQQRSPISVKATSTIFQCGLDSISAITLARQLRKAGHNISVADMLEKPRLVDIAQHCDRYQVNRGLETSEVFDLDAFDAAHRPNVLGRLKLNDESIQAVWPCTATQSGILAQTLKSGGYTYYNRLELCLNEHAELDKLQCAWDVVMNRHEILRTTFVELNNHAHPYAMIVRRSSTVDLPWADVRNSTQTHVVEVDASHDILNVDTLPWSLQVTSDEESIFVKLTMHHALYDAISLQQIFDDVHDAYFDYSMRYVGSAKKALSRILWLNGNLQADEFTAQIADHAEATIFPSLSPRNCDHENEAIVEVINLAISYDSLRSDSARLGHTSSVVCQAAWCHLLSAYTGQENVSFAFTFQGRNFHELDSTTSVLPCVTTLPICASVGSSPELLQSLASANAAAIRCEHVQPVRISQKLGYQQRFLNTLMVVHQPYMHNDVSRLWKITSEKSSAEYAVSFEILPRGDGVVQAQLTTTTKFMPADHARILLEQFEYRVMEILGLHDRTMVASDNKAILWAQRPPVRPEIPSNFTLLHDMVLESRNCYPDDVALEFVDGIDGSDIKYRSWTFANLVSTACQIAHLLLDHGVKTGDLVGICFNKCPEASISLLGALLAGCGYVAIDPDAPNARKNFVAQDANCRVVLTNHHSNWPVITEMGTISSLLLDDHSLWSNLPTSIPQLNRPVAPNDICYCLYTSGTTGTPKGVLISHASVVQAMLSFTDHFKGRQTVQSRWLHFAGLHFDVSVLEHFWSWSVGMRVVSLSRDLLFEDLCGHINLLGITHLDLTPSLAKLLTPESTPQLKDGVFIVGGERVSQEIYDIWGGTGALYNYYGPSEVTIGCTVNPHVRKYDKPSNIGKQWDNVGTYVLKPGTDEIVLRGAIGELCLSGSLVGIGYLNQPELTKSKFVEFRDDRIYRTGDLVRMLSDNSFEFLGRIDDQVKLRGQRLEIAEIDHVLSRCASDLRYAVTVVTGHPDQPRDQLVTFLADSSQQARHGEAPTIRMNELSSSVIEKIRATASEHLPAYMIPTMIVIVGYIPLTVNNKADKKQLIFTYQNTALRDMLVQDLKSRGTNENSTTLQELLRLFQDYFSLDKDILRSSAGLFELGMDSVNVVGLVKLLRSAGFDNANTTLLLTCPNLGALSKQLSKSETADAHEHPEAVETRIFLEEYSRRHRSNAVSLLACSPEDVDKILPCTGLQQGMISRMLASEALIPPYINRFTFQLPFGTSATRLLTAWSIVEQSVDIMRTRFVETEDGHAQVVLRHPAARSNIDTGKDSNVTMEDFVSQVRQLGVARPWNISIDQNDVSAMTMTFFAFHGIYDGTSLPLLLNMVFNAYLSEVLEPSIKLHFADCIGHLIQYARNDHQSFWRSHIPGTKLLSLDGRELRQNVDSTFAQRHIALDYLHGLCSRLNVTSSAVVHACWLLTLAELFGCNPTLGFVVSGRSIELEGVDEVIGPMFNTVPRHVRTLSLNSSTAALIQECHILNVQAIPHQQTPLSDIRRSLGLPGDQPLFDSLFVFQKQMDRPAYSRQWAEVNSQAHADYTLNIEFSSYGDKLADVTVISQRTDVDQLSAASIIEAFVQIISNIHEKLDDLLPKAFTTSAAISTPRQYTKGSTAHTHKDTFSPVEEIVRQVIAGLAAVDVQCVGLLKPSIFELGLDSVDALKVVSRLRQQGLAVAMSKVLKHPTVLGISQQLSRSKTPPSISTRSDALFGHPTEGSDKETNSRKCDQLVLPVTPLQQGLLIDFARSYNVFSYLIAEGVDLGRLQNALNYTVRDLPILRTHFELLETDDANCRVQQIIERSVYSEGGVRHFENLHLLEDHITKMCAGASLAESTPSIKLLRVHDTAYLLLGLSHASYDAWSLNLVHQHISERYYRSETSIERESNIEDYIQSNQQISLSHASQDFWTLRLHGIVPTLVSEAGKAATSCLKHRPTVVSRKAIQHTCQKLGITTQSLGLTAWAIVLASLTRQRDVCFGVVLSGRISEELRNLHFPTFNTIIFRHQLKEKISRADTLQRVHEATIDIYEHQQFPLATAIQLAGIPQAELFNSLFTFQKAPRPEVVLEPLYQPCRIVMQEFQPPYAVNVELAETDEGLTWTVGVQRNVMDGEAVDKLLTALSDTLASLVVGSEQDISQILDDLLPEMNELCDNTPSLVVCNNDTEIVHSSTHTEVAEEEWTSIQITLRQIFAQNSGIPLEQITKHTKLFSLGIDSIASIKIANTLRKHGWQASVSQILRGQSIECISKVAKRVEVKDSTAASPNAPLPASNVRATAQRELRKCGIELEDVKSIQPATSGQAYMLDLWRSSHKKLSCAIFWLEISVGEESRVMAAFTSVGRNMSVLQSRFLLADGQYYQVILKNKKTVHYHPPWHVNTHKRGDKVLALLTIHHVLYDAVSIDLFLREVGRRLQSDVQALECITDTTEFLQLTAASESDSRRQEFWQSYLGQCSADESHGGSFEAARIEVYKPDFTGVEAILTRAREASVSVQALFFASVGRVLSATRRGDSSTDRESIVFGIYLANRTLAVDKISQLAAPTFSIVPLKVDVIGGILQSAQQVQQDLINITEGDKCGVTLKQIYEWTGYKVDCFVNFLRLPKADEAEEELGENRAGKEVIRQAAGEALRMAQQISNTPITSPLLYQGGEVTDSVPWSLPALDIEAKVDEDVNLGMGVFVPSDMMTEGQVKQFMDDVKKQLGADQ